MQNEIEVKKSVCGIFNLKKLKYKQRDELIERIDMWKKLISEGVFLKKEVKDLRENRIRRLY